MSKDYWVDKTDKIRIRIFDKKQGLFNEPYVAIHNLPDEDAVDPSWLKGKVIKGVRYELDTKAVRIDFESKLLIDILKGIYDEIKTSGMVDTIEELTGINKAAAIVRKHIDGLEGGTY